VRRRRILRRRWEVERASAEKELRTRAVGAGDCLGRYPMEDYMDIRLLPGKRRRIEALVRWEGERWVTGEESPPEMV
jgi:hypothetical protein